MPRSRRRSKPPSRASSSTRAAGSSVPERRPEPRDRLARRGLVEAERRRQRQRVQSAVRRAVAAAERLRERVAEREHRAAEGSAGVAGAAKELLARLGVPGLLDHPRQPGHRSAPHLRERRGRSPASARGRTAPRRSARARSATCRRSPGSAAPASASARRRLRAGSRPRRRRASDGRGRGRRRTTSIRRLSTSSAPRRAAARSRPTPPCPCRSRCRRRSRRSCRRPPAPRSGATAPPPSDPELRRHVAPARARNDERPLAGQRRQLLDPPADDHSDSLARANSTKASAARVGVRPDARASEISRRASSPSPWRR